MAFTWSKVNIEVPNTNANIRQKYVELIKCSSGCVKPGEVLAIMGPSGGGKTTLLNILAGKIPKGSYTQGDVLYNGQRRNKDTWTRNIGMVDQDDIIYEDLTIEDTIRYSGKFRSKNYSEDALQRVLKDLKLDDISKNKMNKISGGQRKRTMIAMELIADPEIIFMDEPTSGLDAQTAYQLCEFLKKLAVEKNKIIILTIHQPSEHIFNIFDQVMLISNGKELYYGETSKIEEFLNKKGLQKCDKLSLPEFIINICDKEYQKKHPTVFLNEATDFSGNSLVKDSNKRKSSNDFVVKYKPNFYHIYLLFLRRLKMIKYRKYNFFKGQLIKLVLCLVILYPFIQFSNALKDICVKDISSTNSNLKEILMFIEFLSKIVTGITILSVLTYIQIIASTTSVYDDSPIIEKELRQDTYTAASYIFSLAL